MISIGRKNQYWCQKIQKNCQNCFTMWFAVKFFVKDVLNALLSIMTIISTSLCLLCVTLFQYDMVLFSNKLNLFKRKKQLFLNVF